MTAPLPGLHIDGRVRAEAGRYPLPTPPVGWTADGADQFARDLRGDHDSPLSYHAPGVPERIVLDEAGARFLGIDPHGFRSIFDAEAEREDH